MGFVAIFVPGTKYITCDELSEYVEESKQLYDATYADKTQTLNEEEARNMLKQQKRKFLLLDARRKDEFCVSHILKFILSYILIFLTFLIHL
jgi:CO dehydrogenase/acetyl-CoA synthase epsilon subunit